MFILLESRLEVYPLEFDDSVCIDPFGRDLSIETKLLNLDGSEFIDSFGSCGVEEHTYFKVSRHVLDVLKQLFSFRPSIRLPLISSNFVVFFLHLFSTIGHSNHDFLEFLHLNFMNLFHSCLCFFLFFQLTISSIT